MDYTHVHTDTKSPMTLDHFVVTPHLLPLIEESGVIHRGDNRLRHSPIQLLAAPSGPGLRNHSWTTT